VFPQIFLLHKVVRDAKKVEKHWARRLLPHITLVTEVDKIDLLAYIDISVKPKFRPVFL